MSTIQFDKMHALGNDFLVFESLTQDLNPCPKKIAELSDRRTGIGFDQCLWIAPPLTPDADFGYHIFNADGSASFQCGNGLRAVALLSEMRQWSFRKKLRWQTQPELIFQTEFRSPEAIWTALPLNAIQLHQHLTWAGSNWAFHVVDVGNPHAVFWDPLSHDPAIQEKIFQVMQQHALFPQGTNVSFAQKSSPGTIDLIVYERGVGQTRACGSGAAATLAVAVAVGAFQSRATVLQQGGALTVIQDNPNAAIEIIGPATWVYTGQIHKTRLEQDRMT